MNLGESCEISMIEFFFAKQYVCKKLKNNLVWNKVFVKEVERGRVMDTVSFV